MARESELPQLLQWLEETIEPIQGRPWKITLNSGGAFVVANAQIVISHTEKSNQSITDTRMTEAKFQLVPLNRRIAFRID